MKTFICHPRVGSFLRGTSFSSSRTCHPWLRERNIGSCQTFCTLEILNRENLKKNKKTMMAIAESLKVVVPTLDLWCTRILILRYSVHIQQDLEEACDSIETYWTSSVTPRNTVNSGCFLTRGTSSGYMNSKYPILVDCDGSWSREKR